MYSRTLITVQFLRPVLSYLFAVIAGAALTWRMLAVGKKTLSDRKVANDNLVSVIATLLASLTLSRFILPPVVLLSVNLYGILVCFGLSSGVILALHQAKQEHLDIGITAQAIGVTLAGCFVGARIFDVLVHWAQFLPLLTHPRAALSFVMKSGWVFLGGAAGGIIFAIGYFRLARVSPWPYLDVFMPCVAWAQIFGRIGCFFAGCCYGTRCSPSLPLGVHFPPDSIAFRELFFRSGGGHSFELGDLRTASLNPVQLYESFGNLVIFLSLFFWIRPRRRFEAQVFIGWLILYGFLRFVLEFFRGDISRGFRFGLSTGQLMSISCVAVGFELWRRKGLASPDPMA